MAVPLNDSVGFAIGNGLSREHFGLTKLEGNGIIVGCNYLYTEMEPDFLVTLDHGMSNEIRELVEYGWPRRWKWLTRFYPDHDSKRTWLAMEGEPLRPLIEINQGYNNNSGVMAAAFLAEIVNVSRLYLIGMDFFLDVPGRENDLYWGNTRRSQGLAPVWNLLVSRNPDTKFIRVGEIAEYDVGFYRDVLKGMEYMDYPEFESNVLVSKS